MTQPTDNSFQPQPQSGQGLHTQESGDAGLSSNMKHRFSDNYYENTLPVTAKGCFVTPIPKGELNIIYRPAMGGKIWSRPLMFEYAAGPKSHDVSAEEGFIKPPTLAKAESESSPKEATVKVSTRTTAILEGQTDVEVAGKESCIKMDARGNPAKPKGPPLVPGDRRSNNHQRKRAARNYKKLFLLVCLMALLPVSEGFPGAQPATDKKPRCFTCMDKARCPKLMTIYESDRNKILFRRDLNQTLPDCSAISPPGPQRCDVCLNHHNTTIFCSEDISKFDVEDNDGGQIVDISPDCGVKSGAQKNGCAHVGSSVSTVLCFILQPSF
ncbi:uncharacterized protein LOC121945595 isoform X2 [Plectropomus leopardus]|uniref:uncharacterized protein LOC121945595 isoform X2 n=1 Tax=Plectropomus leopardus TaxID=160734 RepID=UPI001C4D22C3|nr:uncharacterized protein LOC121945595 isoform X2 [Plectropomus leopardus]